jgi:hypothetical protein
MRATCYRPSCVRMVIKRGEAEALKDSLLDLLEQLPDLEL